VSGADGFAPDVPDPILRPGRTSTRDVLLDLALLAGLALVLVGAGFGLRDPWPPDEPRFVLIAQDMLRSGDWMLPRVGGDLYADKPPLYLWLLAGAMAFTGSMRSGFLLPSLLAGLGTTWLVYDLVRRAHGREAALAGAFALLVTFQFVWQARQAQIDGVLCFLTTLSLYGLLRHALLGPAHLWFVAGWAAAGFGVITKGVGFLPLLALIPSAVLARRGWQPVAASPGRLWLAGGAAMLAAIGTWLVPMLAATARGGDLLAYRNEILFEQTLTRYAGAWHHHEPPWYYLTNVIPVLWLPLVALVPWLWPRWRAALRARDPWTGVLLGWVALVVVFFSASSGKRGVYVLPALPALAMAAAPWLPQLMRQRGPRRLAFGLGVVLVALAAAGAAYFALDAAAAARIAAQFGVHPTTPLVLVAAGGGIALLLRPRRGWLAYAGVLVALMVTIGVVISPGMDDVRSGRVFVQRVEQASAGIAELGIVGAREQYLLVLSRPSVNFGHARWREREVEAADAAAWLVQRPGRALLVEELVREACFGQSPAVDLGRANRQRWFLVSGSAEADCIARGDSSRAIVYRPPDAH
jgi:4-amino-4-deoxy-L-arabinose transferase-like glycosyltransferase